MKVVLMDERHSIWIRICHWINMVAIFLLIFTGFYIHAPQSFPLFGNMDGARMVHFAMAYVLCFGVVLRVYFAIAAKDAHNVVFSPQKDIPNLPSMLKYYLFMSNSHPDYGKYNPGQKAMYTGWFFMVMIQVITGFILYKPQVAFWANMGEYLGGDIVIRLIHLAVTWLFVITVLVHVYLDVSEGVPVLKSMFTGKIPRDFHGDQSADKSA